MTTPFQPYAQITSAFSSDVLSHQNYSLYAPCLLPSVVQVARGLTPHDILCMSSVERGLVLLPIFFLPRPPQSRLAPPWSLANPRLFTLNWSFPPGPGLTLALLPAVNVAYRESPCSSLVMLDRTGPDRT